ncbi:efflux RND transporter permease subunit [Idiomarina xiamenensis]|uniref:Acriflavin resistance protein n=1 Tax=Idiomarina xiamenensis 10-D-4 TaxID=740709 RepID=K2KK30_9GAMM|nr:efflux RND transporter permease subunit [Idiomarina xiamenensis]EKE82969.1 acriflavin resistance protein [Idiomarina xiamenensis 10-D-4]
MSIAALAVKRPVTIAMVTLAVMLFGMVALSRLAVNLLPNLSYPTLTIRTDYPGAAPAEVEQLVSKPIEEAIGTVQGIRRVKSISRAEQSDVLLEFAWGTNMDMASLDVREKLDTVELPLDADNALILRFNPALDPIFRSALSSADDSLTADQLKRLRRYADEQLKRQLESIEGVASVRLGGGLEDEIQVLVDNRRISQLQIPYSLINQRLKDENINLSGGRIETQRQEFLVRTLNQFQSLDDIANIYIASRDDRHIRLQDIADIRDGYKERDAITRVDGAETVEISFYKEGDANTVAVAKAIKTRLSQLTDELPDGYRLTNIYDQSLFIDDAISEVKAAAISGGILAMLIIYLFLQRVWPTIVISLAIPISIIATFNLMYANNISLNIMSLGGIALAVGMLVDNAIVVLENIARQRQQGSDATSASAVGTQQVTSAIIASTLTTMAVFFPLVFVDGLAGQLFRDQALTVTFALAASLLVAISVIPMLSARQRQADNSQAPADVTADRQANTSSAISDHSTVTTRQRAGRLISAILLAPWRFLTQWLPMAVTMFLTLIWRLFAHAFLWLSKPLLAIFNRGYQAVESGYLTALRGALLRPWLTLLTVAVLASLSFALLPRLQVSLIPAMSQGEFYAEVTLQPGAAITRTDQVLQQLSASLDDNPAVARSYAVAGTGSLLNASPAQGGDYWGRLNVVMADSSSAEQQQQVIEQLRQQAQRLPGVMVKFGTPELFSFSSPLVVELRGYHLASLQQSANQLANALADNKRFSDIRVNMTAGQPEIAIYFDHDRLAAYGLTAPAVADVVASQVGGNVATQYNLRDRKIDVLVRSQAENRDSVADMQRLIINPGQAQEISLAAVADIRVINGPSEITRIGQQRTAIVEANLNYGDLAAAASATEQLLQQLTLPSTVKASIAGQNEEMQQSFRSLKFALALAVFLVYLVMASQFESLLHPLLILFTVPLAAAGSILGLVLTNTPLSIIVFIGLIMLAGIVVNNAIVLVDRINQLRQQGESRWQAVYQSAASRLRPILMTTLTTVLGLLPLAIGGGDGAEIRTPMAITVISGLLFATLLTLFLIPALYLLADRKSDSNSAPSMHPQGVSHD